MKTLKLISFIAALFLINALQAQVSVNVNLGAPPLWGPVGYSEAQYYYLPEVESYYDVRNARFIYYERGAWVHRRYLPVQYRSYDLYGGYKVVMTDYHGNSPYAHFKEHKVKYHKGYKGQYQKTIGNKPVSKKMWYKDANKNQSLEKEKGSKPGKSKSPGHDKGGGKGKKK
jgi:hypothetical protein